MSLEDNFSFPFGIEYYESTLYVAALANHLVGEDLSEGDVAITVEFNLDYKSDFYFGTVGGVQNNQWDLVTLVLHELAHGHTTRHGKKRVRN